MTEFSLGDGSILGLMPEEGIVRLLGSAIRSPSTANGIPRAELYLIVQDAAMFHVKAVAAGAREVSGLQPRDWGHLVAYSLDPDGHILAFASPITELPNNLTQPKIGLPGDVRSFYRVWVRIKTQTARSQLG